MGGRILRRIDQRLTIGSAAAADGSVKLQRCHQRCVNGAAAASTSANHSPPSDSTNSSSANVVHGPAFLVPPCSVHATDDKRWPQKQITIIEKKTYRFCLKF